jgi:methane/ammonia monooxygenase subunit B
MRSVIRRVCALIVAALAVTMMAPASPASAHGEAAQEAFLRMGTVVFWDVEFSSDTVSQGEEFTITGNAKILETYPEQLAEPKLGFIGVVAPGPVVIIKERTINGQAAPMAIEVEKGGVYHFEMTLQGRRPGKWHVHPILGIHGAGSLIGPGQYINVNAVDGGFTNPVTLANGDKVDLESLGLGNLTFWNILWMVIAMVWLLLWIVPKPTVTRLPVNLQIPLNTDGQDYGLITKKDHRNMDIIMALTLVLLVGGMFYVRSAYPDRLPQQVLRFAPAAAEMDDVFVEGRATGATFTSDAKSVTMKVSLTNNGTAPATVEAFNTSSVVFDGQARSLEISPDATIAPGETKELLLTMEDPIWKVERLLPIGESRMQITGVVRVADSAGNENFVTVQSFVQPEGTL